MVVTKSREEKATRLLEFSEERGKRMWALLLAEFKKKKKMEVGEKPIKLGLESKLLSLVKATSLAEAPASCFVWCQPVQTTRVSVRGM